MSRSLIPSTSASPSAASSKRCSAYDPPRMGPSMAYPLRGAGRSQAPHGPRHRSRSGRCRPQRGVGAIAGAARSESTRHAALAQQRRRVARRAGRSRALRACQRQQGNEQAHQERRPHRHQARADRAAACGLNDRSVSVARGEGARLALHRHEPRASAIGVGQSRSVDGRRCGVLDGGTVTAYYNENDLRAAEWLRNLIGGGHIAPGIVDTRSIEEVRPDELKPFTQCHFFAGIGLWSHSLRLAGWADTGPCWTGSCPCQPFSVAGKGRGTADERHLWPAFFHLIAQRQPSVIFGEQVASADGRTWLATVRSDLEATGYAVGAADLCAAGVGAPHIRQRLYWVADAERVQRSAAQGFAYAGTDGRNYSGMRGEVRGLADSTILGRRQRSSYYEGSIPRTGAAQRRGFGLTNDGDIGVGLGDADDSGPERRRDELGEHAGECAAWASSPWRDVEWLQCTDGKARPTQPGLFPLAHGLPRSVGLLPAGRRRLVAMAGLDDASLRRARQYRVTTLRGYGNAIVPQVAREFIAAYMDAVVGHP